MREIAAEGGDILFVGTKKQAQEAIKEEAKRAGMYFINQRWLGGTLTNFQTIQKRIDRLERYRKNGKKTVLSKYFLRKKLFNLKKKKSVLRNS